jgi:hypothetical protein
MNIRTRGVQAGVKIRGNGLEARAKYVGWLASLSPLNGERVRVRGLKFLLLTPALSSFREEREHIHATPIYQLFRVSGSSPAVFR